MSDIQNKDGDFLARRRQLLKLGAAGVPMVLTLKASAAQPVHSALDCAFVIQNAVTILVDYDGKAWMGDGSIREKNGKYKTKDVEQFKNNADYVFPDSTVPERFRPDECEAGENEANGNDCGWGNDIDDPVGDNDDQDSCPADPPRETPWFEEEGEDGEPGNRPNEYGGNGNDWRHGNNGNGNDNGNGNGGWTDCYTVYEISSNTSITPADYLNGSGNWNLNGDKGLYLLLAGKYLDTYGNDGGFPGISCLLSILNYLEMQ